MKNEGNVLSVSIIIKRKYIMKTQDDMFWTLWGALNCRCSFPHHVASYLFTIFDNRSMTVVWAFDECYAFSPNLPKHNILSVQYHMSLEKSYVFHKIDIRVIALHISYIALQMQNFYATIYNGCLYNYRLYIKLSAHHLVRT